MRAPPGTRHRPRSAPAWLVWRCTVRAMLPSLPVVLVPALMGFLLSDVMRLREIVVCAGSASLAEEVAGALDVPAAANTLTLPARFLAGQAKAVARVRSVHAKRQYPSRIELIVEERVPVFVLQTAHGFVLVDEEGVLLLHTGKARQGMPVVLGDRSGDPAIGGRLGPDCLRTVLDCIEGARAADVGLDFVLDLQVRYDYKLRLPSGVTVKIGGPDNIVRKVVMAAAIERHILSRGGGIEYIDVRIPLRPVYKPAGGKA